VDKLAHQPLYKEHIINDDLSQGIYPDVVTEFDVANAEEEMNQAITNYGNLCYILGQQRAEAMEEKKTFTVTAHFDGMMELTVQAASAEQARDMAQHPAFRNAWVIDDSTIKINTIWKAEETK
jgi:hypothetical protein